MSKPYVYITRKIPEKLISAYRDYWDIHMWPYEEDPVDRETLLQEVKKADALFCLLTDKVDESLLENATGLKVIANLAVGYDNINITLAESKGIVVTNTPDVLTETTADLTFGLLLSTARRIVEASDYIKQGKWENWSPFLLAGNDIFQKNIGIVGMGRIGEAVARRAKGFGMNIAYHNRSRKYEAERILDATYLDFDELITISDFVVNLVPLTNQTRYLFNEAVFEKMKDSAIFINASRGQTVNEQDLYKALINNKIKAAGLDVFEDEPIGQNHPLVGLDQVVCLPHIGSASVETRSIMVKLSLENIDLVLAGKKARTPVVSKEAN